MFLAPIAASLACVHLASRLVRVPTDSLWLFALWWVALGGMATAILMLVDRFSRKLLPLAALLKLSLVFPDRAPSRFRTALRAGTVESLAQRVNKAKATDPRAKPVQAAQRLLELVAALDAHDRLTRGHAERVRAYAQMIGEELRLGKDDRDLLNWAALLHDVGKLSVPSEILTKPGRLTDEEFEAVKHHPELGEELVAPLRGWLGEWADAVGDHHERWDGNGYPRRKAGEDIALAGRIVAVADVFDVITSSRSYKEASSAVEARKELARHAGTQFDERMVRAFLGISLGRLRLAMGPLAWLAHAPMLGRIPVTPAISTLTGTLAVVAAAVTTGLVVEPDAGRAESALPPPPKEAVAPQPPPSPPPVTRRSPRPPAPPAPSAKRRAEPRGHPAAVRVAPHVDAAVDEDSEVVVPLDGITGAADVISLRISMPPHAGRSAETPDRAIFYRPPRDYNGRTTIGYEVCRQGDPCALGEVRITVRPVNDAPDVSDDVGRTEEDEPVSIDVLANDSDVDGEQLRLSSASGETRGNAVVRDGRLTWSGPRNFNGEASFAYTAEDKDGATDKGSVTIRVAPVNDAPSAAPDKASTQEGVPVRIRVLANDSDLDGDPLEILAVEHPQRGSATHDGAAVTYSPPADFSGSTTFTYRATDGHGGQAKGAVEVSVAAVNDAPRAVDDGASVLENGSTAIDVLANDVDPEGEPLTLASVGRPSSGTSARDGDRLLFTAPDTSDAVSLEYVVRDAQGATDSGRVAIEVVGVNDPPSFVAGSDQSLLEDSGKHTVAGWAQAITTGPVDESSQTVVFLVENTNPTLFTMGGQPALSAEGTLTYTPAANANGSAGVTVRARDDGGTANGGSDVSAPHTFEIVVDGVNDAPTTASDFVSVVEDSAGVTFDVLANDTDPDGDSLSLASYDGSTVVDGTLTHDGDGLFTFVPEAAYNGSQTFTYTVGDGNGGNTTTAVMLFVTPQPDAPVAADDAYVTTQNTPVIQAAPGVLHNDGDEDGDPLTVQTPIVAPSSGTLSLAADGSFTYTPNAGFLGTDAFTYRIADGTGSTDDAVVTLTVSSTVSTSLLFLGTSGLTADVWDLTTSPPPAASPVPDFEGDGFPGLSIYSSTGGEAVADPTRWHTWARPVSLQPLVLNGPVTLQLWSTIAGFAPDEQGHPHVYLYDCLAGGIACVKIAQNHEQVLSWNGGVSDWVYREITVGSVSRTIAVGRELRIRIQSSRNDLWLAMTAAYPSALQITGP